MLNGQEMSSSEHFLSTYVRLGGRCIIEKNGRVDNELFSLTRKSKLGLAEIYHFTFYCRSLTGRICVLWPRQLFHFELFLGEQRRDGWVGHEDAQHEIGDWPESVNGNIAARKHNYLPVFELGFRLFLSTCKFEGIWIDVALSPCGMRNVRSEKTTLLRWKKSFSDWSETRNN